VISRSLAALCATAALVPVAPARASVPAVPPGPATSGDFAGQVAIPAGRSLYLECHGAGWPAVVFEAGLRGRGDSWLYSSYGDDGGVFSRVASFTRACTYDRPGTALDGDLLSRSDPVPMPRSTGEAADDLQSLLWSAGVPGPYVLVGASTGGLIARQFAGRYASEVGGLVLVDAISEAMQPLLGPERFARYNLFYLQAPPPGLDSYGSLESIDFYRSFAEMRAGPQPPRRLPEVVLSNDYGFGEARGSVTQGFARIVNRAWKRSQRYLASLDPRARRVTATGSGHRIAINRPGLVARMVARVVAAVRR
jgi:pimeloyl-ACP methyl ester carboxylesterase